MGGGGGNGGGGGAYLVDEQLGELRVSLKEMPVRYKKDGKCDIWGKNGLRVREKQNREYPLVYGKNRSVTYGKEWVREKNT